MQHTGNDKLESARPGLILQHGTDGPPGIFTEWLRARGIPFEIHETWREPLPDRPEAYPWICSLGSEHTPGKTGAPGWVDDEIGFLRTCLEAEVPILGLCFGGQALTAAAGGSVSPAQPPEVGWRQVASSDPEAIPPGPWLHFHFDQLEPPEGAVELARSPAGCAAFRLGPHLALQFHPEATVEIVTRWAELDRGRLGENGVDPAQVEAEGRAHETASREAAFALFDAWWDSLGGGRR